jgi:hypothetical protein
MQNYLPISVDITYIQRESQLNFGLILHVIPGKKKIRSQCNFDTCILTLATSSDKLEVPRHKTSALIAVKALLQPTTGACGKGASELGVCHVIW